MKNKNNLQQKAIGGGFKKVFYRHRLSGFKRIAIVMLAGGLIFAFIGAMMCTYKDYAVAHADISLLYPQISSSGYPDNSRFGYYDFVSNDKIEKALEIMRNDGKYEHYTVDDIKKKIFVYNHLENLATDAVSTERDDGNDYSYVANEYQINFVQPHDYKNPNFFKKIFSPDYSRDFLRALMQVNKKEFSDRYSGYTGFITLTDMGDTSGYDYGELVNVYRSKINSVIDYLDELEGDHPGFVSSNGYGVKDLVGEYKILLSNRLDSISSFINTSGISKNIAVASNKLRVNIEDKELQFNKYGDNVEINKFAQDEYDHTFTENLIVVTIHETYGLYQARPKTAYDIVTNEKMSSMKAYENYQTQIRVLNDELSGFSNAVTNAEEYTRLCNKCEDLISELEEEYKSVTKTAKDVVRQYSNSVNKDYIKYKTKSDRLISREFIMDVGIMFVSGVVLSFVLYVVISMVQDKREINEKERMLRYIKKNKEGER